MPLIDLKLISELAVEANSQRMLAEVQSYGWEKENRLDSVTYMGLIKTHYQASNLLKQLRALYEVCVDFAAGHFEGYLNDFEEFTEEDLPYFLFDDLSFYFNRETVYSLPSTIEQYDELVNVAAVFAKIQAAKEENFARFFGNASKQYLSVNQEGRSILIPESAMPADELSRIQANNEIRDIEIEYCLDGYNQFYEQCLQLIQSHQEKGDIQGCAEKILQLYK